jgi:hypothetical protein
VERRLQKASKDKKTEPDELSALQKLVVAFDNAVPAWQRVWAERQNEAVGHFVRWQMQVGQWATGRRPHRLRPQLTSKV